MKTKTNKRVLAWVLSICMAIALLPAMPVEYAQAAEGDLVFNFTGLTESTNQDGGEHLWDYSTNALNTFGESLKDINVTTANGSDPWVLVEAIPTTKANIGFHKDRGISFYVWSKKQSNTTWTADIKVKLEVEEGQEGWYNVIADEWLQITSGLLDYGSYTCNLALKNGDSDSASDMLPMATVNASSDFNSLSMGTTYFDDGEYYFSMHLSVTADLTSITSNLNTRFFLKDLTFEKVDFSIAPSAASAELVEGKSTDITLALNQAGTAYSGDVTYSAEVGYSENEVVTAIVNGNTLTVSGVNEGKIDVTVTAKVDGNPAATLTIPVTVTKPVHPTFGTSYAYIREDYDGEKTTYKLILIAAVDSLDYTKVGFNYTIGEAEEKSTEETAAYKTLTFNGASLTADNLGGTESGYLFYSEIDLTADEAASAIEFKAYADEKVGGTYSIDTAYYTAQ